MHDDRVEAQRVEDVQEPGFLVDRDELGPVDEPLRLFARRPRRVSALPAAFAVEGVAQVAEVTCDVRAAARFRRIRRADRGFVDPVARTQMAWLGRHRRAAA
jgi:hypothetical protein